MRRPLLNAVMLAVLVCSCAYGESNPDPEYLLQVAVGRLNDAKSLKTKFTYLDLNHIQNFNMQGDLLGDVIQLFEVTYIGGLQYSRLLETGGKPLSGEALEAEQRRYDAAVRDRSALDDNARARLEHELMKDVGLNLGAVASQYRNIVIDHAEMNHHMCLAIDSTPLPFAPQKQYRIWLDAARDEIVRVEFTQLADEGDMLKGGMGYKIFTYMEGVPLVLSSHLDVLVIDNRGKKMRVVADHAYSKFRKFAVTSTIVPSATVEKK